MTHISNPIVGTRRGSGRFSVKHFDVSSLDDGGSPILLLDDFHVEGRPFGPHPHAGFSAITYVFEDSVGSLRSRDSLGNDLTIAPGGIAWLQAGRGALHEETPEIFGEDLHGAQIYVNLRAENKMSDPCTFWLQPQHVPVWDDANGNRVRVVVGRYQDLRSPLTPLEPFNLLDICAASGVVINVDPANHTLVYARGGINVVSGENRAAIEAGQVISVRNTPSFTLTSSASSRVLLLSGAAIKEPREVDGPFVLNHPHELQAAIKRFKRGEMGHLAPRP